MPWSGLEAVLFDLDGTLIDHDSAAASAVVAALRELPGCPALDRHRVIRRWAELEAPAMERHLFGELTFTEQRRARIVPLAAELGLGTWSDEQADAWFGRYLPHYQAAWRGYADAEPALIALASHRPELRLGVITNGDASQQRQKLQHAGLAEALPCLTVSGEAGSAKPGREIFEVACARLALRPAQVAYVGDRLDTDAEAATRAGLRGIWLDRHGTGRTISVPRITALTDLPPLLAGRPVPGGSRRPVRARPLRRWFSGGHAGPGRWGKPGPARGHRFSRWCPRAPVGWRRLPPAAAAPR